ncbi:trypsin-like serine peptidase [Longispora albida]|uniref:trypsin-like serine peptidase n=1 Tax=Longispora albida TaxID=203523 RepID=UPI00036231C2|nr:trypsin-like serine protease [Longispora albida]
MKPYKRLRAVVVATALAAALLSSVAPAMAADGDPGTGTTGASLETPVTSDGTPTLLTPGTENVQSEDSFEGTGIETGDTDMTLAPPSEPAIGDDSIIGADNRYRVNPTTGFPSRAVALITFDGGRCTGWLYGKDIVATAGHCVHSGGSDGAWKRNVRVWPGYNGTTAPYGSCTAKRLHSVSGWTSSKDKRYDYGAVKLNCTVGNTTGWFGYWWQSASMTGLSSRICGYPGDKPKEQWCSNDSIRVTHPLQLFYQNDTVGGHSGSPVYQLRASGSSFCSGWCGMAIHAYGVHNGAPWSTNNSGTRITESRFTNLKGWKDAA